METHAETYSSAYRAKKGLSFWEKNFDEMAKKTMLRQLISKWGVMSIDFISAYEGDGAIIHENGSREYVVNDEEVIEQEEPQIEAAVHPMQEGIPEISKNKQVKLSDI